METTYAKAQSLLGTNKFSRDEIDFLKVGNIKKSSSLFLKITVSLQM